MVATVGTFVGRQRVQQPKCPQFLTFGSCVFLPPVIHMVVVVLRVAEAVDITVAAAAVVAADIMAVEVKLPLLRPMVAEEVSVTPLCGHVSLPSTLRWVAHV